MRRWPNVGLLLAHRQRRWTSSKPTLGQRILFAGLGIETIGPALVHWDLRRIDEKIINEKIQVTIIIMSTFLIFYLNENNKF